jgi:hypothetical protein
MSDSLGKAVVGKNVVFREYDPTPFSDSLHEIDAKQKRPQEAAFFLQFADLVGEAFEAARLLALAFCFCDQKVKHVWHIFVLAFEHVRLHFELTVDKQHRYPVHSVARRKRFGAIHFAVD